MATPNTAYSGAPIAGPMTRERFICTDWSDTAPGRSSFGTSVGRIAPIAGPLSALPMPMTSTKKKSSVSFGCDCGGEEREHDREHELLELHPDQELAAVEHVGEHPAETGEEQQRAELGEVDEADVGGVVGELQRVRAEDDVLHPGADVRRERPAPDDAEVPVAQRRARGADERVRSPSTSASVASSARGS